MENETFLAVLNSANFLATLSFTGIIVMHLKHKALGMQTLMDLFVADALIARLLVESVITSTITTAMFFGSNVPEFVASFLSISVYACHNFENFYLIQMLLVRYFLIFHPSVLENISDWTVRAYAFFANILAVILFVSLELLMVTPLKESFFFLLLMGDYNTEFKPFKLAMYTHLVGYVLLVAIQIKVEKCHWSSNPAEMQEDETRAVCRLMEVFASLLAVIFSVIAIMAQRSSGMEQKNIYGRSLQICSTNPMTGWYRDGYAKTDENDRGSHTVCATMTAEFLAYTKSQGNDLSTPHLPHFPGLVPGNSWALCAARWFEAYTAGFAPLVKLEATNIKALEVVPKHILEQFDDRNATRNNPRSEL